MSQKRVDRRKTKVDNKSEIRLNGHIDMLIFWRIDDWILDVFSTSNPFQVVKYFKMGLRNQQMKVSHLR